MKTASFFPLQRLYRRSGKSPSGQIMIEALAGIIIFAIMLALVMTICMWLYVQQALVTSAREGARQAALNAALAGSSTRAAGVAAVQAYIQDEMLKLTGQSLGSSDITVLGPTGTTPGQRTVQVTLVMSLKNPIGVAGLLGALGANAQAFDTIPLSASATLRYEE